MTQGKFCNLSEPQEVDNSEMFMANTWEVWADRVDSWGNVSSYKIGQFWTKEEADKFVSEF